MRAQWWIGALAAWAVGIDGAALPAAVMAEQPAAVVNGETITLEEVDEFIKEWRPPSPVPLTEAQKRQLRMEALAILIDDLLMQQFLHKHGAKVEKAEIDQALRQLAENLQKQEPPMSMSEFYKHSGQSEEDLRASFELMLSWSGYVKARLKEEEVQKYYADNKVFFDQIKVRASHIFLRLLPDMTPQQRQEAHHKLTTIRQQILSGQIDFAEAAKKFSQCPSGVQGGDLNYFLRKGTHTEDFARAAFDLKVGDISDVVQTEFGYHLIKVTDRTVGEPSDYAAIKDQVRDLYVEEMRQALLAEERQNAKIEVHLP
ncbi:MAG: peptidylprolyl isomerase [Gemmataceae bacterium]